MYKKDEGSYCKKPMCLVSTFRFDYDMCQVVNKCISRLFRFHDGREPRGEGGGWWQSLLPSPLPDEGCAD